MKADIKQNTFKDNAVNVAAAEAELKQDVGSMAEHYDKPINFLIVLPPGCSNDCVEALVKATQPIKDRLYFSYGPWVKRTYAQRTGPTISFL